MISFDLLIQVPGVGPNIFKYLTILNLIQIRNDEWKSLVDYTIEQYKYPRIFYYTHTFMQKLKNIKNLQLDLHETVRHLGNFQNLKLLEFNYITSPPPFDFRLLDGLQTLKIRGENAYKLHFHHLKNLKVLEYTLYSWEKCCHIDEMIEDIAECPKLTDLTISGVRDIKTLRVVSGMTNLERLNIWSSLHLDPWISSSGLTPLKKLTHLSVRGTSIFSSVKNICQLTNLRSLDLGGNPFQCSHLLDIPKLTNLYELNINECSIEVKLMALNLIKHGRVPSIKVLHLLIDGVIRKIEKLNDRNDQQIRKVYYSYHVISSQYTYDGLKSLHDHCYAKGFKLIYQR